MKKLIKTEETFCDICGKQNAYDKCLNCGKDICYSCIKSGKAVRYLHAVHCSGSLDGVYCRECDRQLTESKEPLHEAYLAVKVLRDEMNSWSDSFGKRSDLAEESVKKLFPKE